MELLEDVEREEIEEWEEVLGRWPASRTEIGLRLLTRAGMPYINVRDTSKAATVRSNAEKGQVGKEEPLRRAVWRLLLLDQGSAFRSVLPSEASTRDKRQATYNKLLGKKVDERVRKQIEKDLHRSAPYADERELLTTEVHKTFLPRNEALMLPYASNLHADGGSIEKLRRVLLAYAVYDPDLGYCQGLNFVTFMLLLHLDETDSFWALVGILYGFNLRLMFSSNSAVLPELLAILDHEIRDRFPMLNRHFESQGIAVTMYAMDWLTTFFVYSLHLETNQRVWDILLSRGYEEPNSAVYWLFQVALAAIRLCHDQLLAWGLEEIMQGFKRLIVRIPPNEILSVAIDYDLSSDTRAQLEGVISRSKKCVIM